MNKIYKCLISAVLLVAVVFSVAVPSFATDVGDSGSGSVSSDSGVTGSDSGSGSVSGDSGTTDSGSGGTSGDMSTTEGGYPLVNIYAMPDVSIDSTFLGTLKNENAYVLNASPRDTSYYPSVKLSYDSLSSFVLRCNQAGMNVSLEYNRAVGKYLAYVSDTTIFGKKVTGCLGNRSGSIYLADPESSGGSTTTPSKPPTVTPSTPSTGTTPGSPGYVSKPTTDDEIDLLQRITFYVDLANEYSSITLGWLKLIYTGVKNIQNYCANLVEIGNNTIQGMGSLIDTLELHLPDLKYIKDISTTSTYIANQIGYFHSSFSRFATQFNNLTVNGALAIDTTPLEARLDKLISMYRKVNGVVLDTAAINGSQIVDAVGGELQNPMVYGNSYVSNSKLYYANGMGLTLNGVYTLTMFKDSSGNAVQLRSVTLGSSIPSYISSDPVLLAGVWKSGSNYIISDTLDLSTGIYTKRVQQLVLYGTESGYGVRTRANGSVLYYRTYTGDGQLAAICNYGHFVPYAGAIKSNADASTSVDGTSYTYANGMFCITSTTLTDLTGWTNWLKSRRTAGAALAFFYVDGSSSTFKVTPKDTGIRELLTIPEGNSTISVQRSLRLTAKYETYDSYTMQADIITAINNLQLGSFDDSNIVAALSRIEYALSNLDLDIPTGEIADRINVEIDASSDAFNVFYVTDSDGNTTPVATVAGDLTKASGRLLSMLYRLVFADALGSIDSDLDGFEDFFSSTEPDTTAMQGAYSVYEDVIDVWSVS